MGLETVLCMNEGNGASSYANNSILQKVVLVKARALIEKAINEVYNMDVFPECLKIADFGCSSGPNTLFVMYNIIEIVHAICKEKAIKVPEFQVFLNDLPSNDFNTLFKLLPQFFHDKVRNLGENYDQPPCFVAGVPGSFYSRLFPTATLHFVHSSSTSHWLSQVPPEILKSNKGNVYIAKSSPTNVHEAYMNQFIRDFSTFLRVRSKEMIPNGRMFITFCGRKCSDPTSDDCCFPWNMLAKSLFDMVNKGLVCEDDSYSFNIPMYFPVKDEVETIIRQEDFFELESIETFEINWDALEETDNDKQFDINKDMSSGMFFARTLRAATEPLLVSHFGNSCIDEIFERFAIHVDEHLSTKKPKCFNIVISLKKK